MNNEELASQILDNSREYYINWGNEKIEKVSKEEFTKKEFECMLLFNETASHETPTSSTLLYYNRIINGK